MYIHWGGTFPSGTNCWSFYILYGLTQRFVYLFFQHNRDPNKLRFFIEFLRERFIKSMDTAQTTSVDAHKYSFMCHI